MPLNWLMYSLSCVCKSDKIGGTCQLHPPFFAKISANGGCADVIFVHGLTGDPVDTWSSQGETEPEGKFWPNWLAADLPYLNFYTLGYPASLFVQWAKKEMNLYQRAKNVLETLAGYEFGSRPIVFICHSCPLLLPATNPRVPNHKYGGLAKFRRQLRLGD